MTGLYPFTWTRITNLPACKLDNQQRGHITQAMRAYCLNHWDARVRGKALQSLAAWGMLNAKDLDHGLSDPAVSVQILTAEWATHRLHQRQDDALTTQAVPVLIKHLNATTFIVRAEVVRMLSEFVKRHEAEPAWTPARELFTEKFDWTRRSWDDREAQKNRWQQWWDATALQAAELAPNEPASVSPQG